MEQIRLTKWSEFHQAIEAVRARFPAKRWGVEGGPVAMEQTRILFRGHANSDWALLTTLERRAERPLGVLRYLELAGRIRTELESFTGRAWEVPAFPELMTKLMERPDSISFSLPAYEYLVFLRHHGFASPLLDWTESPYVAAYFAFIELSDSNRAIYCFVETPDGGKGGMVGDANIHLQGPYVRAHPRHFAQRALYTVAVEWNEARKAREFVPHERIFERDDPDQDVLIKIELPASARRDALRSLSDYNINHFTLFQNEDALVKMLESKAFDLASVQMLDQ